MSDKLSLNTYVGANYQFGLSGPSASYKKGLDVEVGQDLLKLGGDDSTYKALGLGVDFMSNSQRTGFFPAASIAFGDKESAVVRVKAGAVFYTGNSSVNDLSPQADAQKPPSVCAPRIEMTVSLSKLINVGVAADFTSYGVDVMPKAGLGWIF